MEITVQELAELIREYNKSEKTKTSTCSSNCKLCGNERTNRWGDDKVAFTLEDTNDGQTALNIFDEKGRFVRSEVIYYCPFCGRKL